MFLKDLPFISEKHFDLQVGFSKFSSFRPKYCTVAGAGMHLVCVFTGHQKVKVILSAVKLGPAPDPKCKLNISSFLTFPHSLDCLICTRNSMSIVLLL